MKLFIDCKKSRDAPNFFCAIFVCAKISSNMYIKPFRIFTFVFIMLSTYCMTAQNVEYKIFRHKNGNIASEGTLVDGKPDGYWKTYYPEGQLKSEGNRVGFELDGNWFFFSETGDTTLIVSYGAGKKNGVSKTFLTNGGYVIETFKNNIKTDLRLEYDFKNRLVSRIPFVNGIEDGTAFSFDTLGNVIQVETYKKGIIFFREPVNRFDKEGFKHGVWKTFYDDFSVKTEEIYVHGERNGIFKEYDKNGNVRSIRKFENDIEADANTVSPLKYKRDYYNNGQIKTEITFRNGKPEGIRRDFDEDGNVVKSCVYRNGVLVSEGIILNDGQKQGLWREYYNDGKLKSEGSYENNNKSGKWKYYYRNQVIEQTGNYNKKGQLSGKWLWYYPDSKLMREENFKRGKLDGMFVEYDSKGRIVEQGEYSEGLKTGNWVEVQGNIKSEGEYVSGNRNGKWISVYDNGKTAFSGSYIDGNANGEHKFYYYDGTLRESVNFIMGVRHGQYRKYLEDGTLYIEVQYENGIEKDEE